MIDISSTWCFLLCPIGFLGIGGCSIANPVPMDFSREEEDVEFEAANLTTEPSHWQIVSKGDSTKQTETVQKEEWRD